MITTQPITNMDSATNQQVLTPTEEPGRHLPVFGLPGYLFYLIHVTALVALPVSALISAGVLFHVIPPNKSFFKRPIGDRIVAYLGICDLLYSLSHMLDHSYMMAVLDHPPDVACAIFAFFLNQFINGQSLIVLFAALNAFALVVLGKKINVGKYDWRLTVYSMGIPFVLGLLGTGTGHFGPSGPWCYIDMRRPLGPALVTAISGVMLITFVLLVVCYTGIWVKIRQVATAQTGNRKYQRTARVMMLFVAAFISQWWPFVVYGAWSLVGPPHPTVIATVVLFCNLGGLFNAVAYAVIRKRYQKVGDYQESESTTKPSSPAA